MLAKEEGITSGTDVANSKVVLQPGNGNKNVQESHIHLNINLSFMLRFYFGLLTLGTLRNTSKNLLNPTDTCSIEEAESGDEGATHPPGRVRSLRQLNKCLVAELLGWMRFTEVLEGSGCCRAVLVNTPPILCGDTGAVPEETVPIGREGDRRVCSNYRGTGS